MDEQPDGQKFCACIVKMIDDHDYNWKTTRNKLNYTLALMKIQVKKSSPTTNCWTTWQKMTKTTMSGNSNASPCIKVSSLQSILISKD
jgi:hypothetical protein